VRTGREALVDEDDRLAGSFVARTTVSQVFFVAHQLGAPFLDGFANLVLVDPGAQDATRVQHLDRRRPDRAEIQVAEPRHEQIA
jgi:hypothetical protein